MDLPARGEWTVVPSGALPHNQISRADVAAFMLETLRENTHVKMTPHISWKSA